MKDLTWIGCLNGLVKFKDNIILYQKSNNRSYKVYNISVKLDIKKEKVAIENIKAKLMKRGKQISISLETCNVKSM